MKRITAALLLLTLVFTLFGCKKQDAFEIEFSIPAGSSGAYVYADEELSPNGNRLRLRAGAGYGKAKFILTPAEAAEGKEEITVTLGQGETITVSVEKGTWYRIGIFADNPDAAAKAAGVYAENVTLRIE
ncbi:MAG: hypothetical protein IJN00_07875 [Clostridia bacterium]|nr:hypothetical protein [Clostridia bacterium]